MHPKQARNSFTKSFATRRSLRFCKLMHIAMTCATVNAGVTGPMAEERLDHELPPVNPIISPIFLLLAFGGALRGRPRSRR